MRCGGEPRARPRSGSEPLLKETSTQTKLLWALGAACALGAILLYTGLREPSEAASSERGLVVQAEDPPPAPTGTAQVDDRAAQAAAARAAAAQREAAAHDEEARQAAALRVARARVPILMYSTTWCGACAGARAYLDAHRIRFTEYDIESNEAARAEHVRLNPARTVPTFDVGGEVLTGFSETAFEAALDTAAARRAP